MKHVNGFISYTTRLSNANFFIIFYMTSFLGEVVLYNIFYEIFTVCTSIVGQDKNGRLCTKFIMSFPHQFLQLIYTEHLEIHFAWS